MLRNNLWAFAALACHWTTGTLLVRQLLGWPWFRAICPGWLLGSGLASLTVLGLHLAGGTLLPWLPIALALQLAAVGAWAFRRPPSAADDSVDAAERPSVFAGLAFAFLAIVAVRTLLHAVTEPESTFDALHNWSFKALSTAIHGRPFEGYWPFVLFPNHVPFLGATFLGLQSAPQETAMHVVPFLFLLSCLGTIAQAAQALSGRRAWGLPAAMLLVVGSPMLLAHADRLYCDLPLAALHLASVYLAICRLTGSRLPAAFLSGIFSGLGMWTKTEGLLLAAGVGGALLLAEWVRTDTARGASMKTLGAWIGGLLLAGGPWPLYLALVRVPPDSSGHLGNALHLERLASILRATFQHFRGQGFVPAIGGAFFLLLGWKRSTRPLYLFLGATLAAGFLHVWLPLLVIPDDAFGGWQTFMENGLNRYCLHFSPVLLLSGALVARTGRAGGLDRLLQRLMVRKAPAAAPGR